MKLIFTINWLIVHAMKCEWSVKNAPLNFPEAIVMSSGCLFRPNKSPKHTDSSFFILNDTEKQQILTSNSFDFFIWKITETINQLSK